MATEQVRNLRQLRSFHRRVIGDYRTGYRITCFVCSVQRSQPGYNETVSWREGEDWPCEQVRIIDALLFDAGEPLPEDRVDQIADNIERDGRRYGPASH